jgi:hypothetical protein
MMIQDINDTALSGLEDGYDRGPTLAGLEAQKYKLDPGPTG